MPAATSVPGLSGRRLRSLSPLSEGWQEQSHQSSAIGSRRGVLQAPYASCDAGAYWAASAFPAPPLPGRPVIASEADAPSLLPGVSIALGPSRTLAAQLTAGGANSLQLCLACVESALPCALQGVCINTPLTPSCFCVNPAFPIPNPASSQCPCARPPRPRTHRARFPCAFSGLMKLLLLPFFR